MLILHSGGSCCGTGAYTSRLLAELVRREGGFPVVRCASSKSNAFKLLSSSARAAVLDGHVIVSIGEDWQPANRWKLLIPAAVQAAQLDVMHKPSGRMVEVKPRVGVETKAEVVPNG